MPPDTPALDTFDKFQVVDHDGDGNGDIVSYADEKVYLAEVQYVCNLFTFNNYCMF